VIGERWARLREDWPRLGILLPAPFLFHAVWVAARGRFHWENAAALVLLVSLFGGGPAARRLLVGVYPVGLVGLLYDTMRVVASVGVTPERVHLCDLRALEIRLFGLTIDGRPSTVHDWMQAHATPALDRLCAIPYGTFIYVSVACALWLFFRDYAAMQRFTWSFLALNVAGFVTYHLYPAAPPWYFHAHGCAVDVLAHASEGPNLARVDAWLGVPYFAGMYGRASSVFGAMPSLHVAYPLLVVFAGWASFGWPLRIAGILFESLMVFAAAYLDHHWVLDIVAGLAYCVAVAAAAAWIARRGTPQPT